MLGHLHLPLPCTLPVGVSYPSTPTSSFFFFSSRRRHTRLTCDWSSDVCSSDLGLDGGDGLAEAEGDREVTQVVLERLDDFDVAELQHPLAPLHHRDLGAQRREIGRASCRERV